MVLNNVWVMDSDSPVNIQIQGAKIGSVSGDTSPDENTLNFDSAIAFPGLINSHDHLDFNLFPPLGDRRYPDYTAWGVFIHRQFKAEIADVLRVPVALREQWGIIKNLLCGVTTVVNHGQRLQIEQPLIGVHEQYQCIHSVKFEKRWKLKLNNPFKLGLPVVIHTGEGTDQPSHREIDRLVAWNVLHRELIGVHGVAMSAKQAKKFKALVWCPLSNSFLLGKTAEVNVLKTRTNLLFGTDSTLTGAWDIWEHIRLARQTQLLTEAELYNTLTVNPARVWGTKNGKLKASKQADIVVAGKKDGQDTREAFFSTRPEDILLVMREGRILLFDVKLAAQLTHLDLSAFNKVYVNNTRKYIAGNVPALLAAIKNYYPAAIFPISTERNNANNRENILETTT
jgi:cytosine/adenosine deaminase-related metal-dependent hydrolase